MAEVYSDWVTSYVYGTNKHRCRITYSISSNATEYTVSAYTQIQSDASCNIQYNGVNVTTNVDGTTKSTNTRFYDTTWYPQNTGDTYASKTIKRTKSDQTISVSGSYSGGGFSGSKSFNITVPKLDSYTVSYNANGGSSAPSSQTKWYNEALKLSSVIPTRERYEFLGWATSQNGSVSYSAGSNYTSNSGITLYAVWKLKASVVTIYDKNGDAHKGVTHFYNDNGELHYAVITVYDEKGEAHNVV